MCELCYLFLFKVTFKKYDLMFLFSSSRFAMKQYEILHYAF
jgi:hypothetical protein